MKTSLSAVLALALVVAGCRGAADSGKSETEAQFEALYRQYAQSFHEKMFDASPQTPMQSVRAESLRLWNDTFADHLDVLQARQEQILGELSQAQPVDMAVYDAIAEGNRDEAEEPEGAVLKQFLWSPVRAAQYQLATWLPRIMDQQMLRKRIVLTREVPVLWQALDKDPGRPTLLQRQGPLVYVVELERRTDHYVATRIRVLAPKAMVKVRPPEGGGEGAGTEGEGTDTPAPPDGGAEEVPETGMGDESPAG